MSLTVKCVFFQIVCNKQIKCFGCPPELQETFTTDSRIYHQTLKKCIKKTIPEAIEVKGTKVSILVKIASPDLTDAFFEGSNEVVFKQQLESETVAMTGSPLYFPKYFNMALVVTK